MYTDDDYSQLLFSSLIICKTLHPEKNSEENGQKYTCVKGYMESYS